MRTADNREEMATGAQENPPMEAGHENTESLEKIRDILFGSQSREFDKRLRSFEESLMQSASALKHDLKTRFDSLESHIKREVESLTDRIKVEHDERAQSITDLMRELKDLSSTMERKTTQLDDQATRSYSELRQQLLDQHEKLFNEIQQKNETLAQTLGQAIQELHEQKVTRTVLAELLVKSAMSLSDELKTAGNK